MFRFLPFSLHSVLGEFLSEESVNVLINVVRENSPPLPVLD